MRYFGERYDAPVYAEIAPMRTPAGAECVNCHKQITEDDDGFEVPCADGRGKIEGFAYFHRRCFLGEIGVPGGAR